MSSLHLTGAHIHSFFFLFLLSIGSHFFACISHLHVFPLCRRLGAALTRYSIYLGRKILKKKVGIQLKKEKEWLWRTTLIDLLGVWLNEKVDCFFFELPYRFVRILIKLVHKGRGKIQRQATYSCSLFRICPIRHLICRASQTSIARLTTTEAQKT